MSSTHSKFSLPVRHVSITFRCCLFCCLFLICFCLSLLHSTKHNINYTSNSQSFENFNYLNFAFIMFFRIVCQSYTVCYPICKNIMYWIQHKSSSLYTAKVCTTLKSYYYIFFFNLLYKSIQEIIIIKLCTHLKKKKVFIQFFQQTLCIILKW